MSYPPPLQNLIDAFKSLPGVGPRTAERYAFALFHKNEEERRSIAAAIENASHVTTCAQCNNFSENAHCRICTDTRRNPRIICVVAEAQDLMAIERAGEHRGVYHVLGGLLSPLEGTTPKELKIEQLQTRITQLKNAKKVNDTNVVEIILAFDQTPEGESTAIYLAKELKTTGAKITRLARGLPTGSDLSYADEMTLSSALAGRREV
ncbi:MAG: recombination mediator RecR [Patescibacteria group bacterium]